MNHPQRLLILAPGTYAEDEAEVFEKVQSAWSKAGWGPDSPKLVQSRVWYEERAQNCGSEVSWALESATGRDYSTRCSHFSCFVVVGESKLPPRMAFLVRYALAAKRPVYRLVAEDLTKIS